MPIFHSLDYIPKTEEEDIVFTLAMVIVHIFHIVYIFSHCSHYEISQSNGMLILSFIYQFYCTVLIFSQPPLLCKRRQRTRWEWAMLAPSMLSTRKLQVGIYLFQLFWIYTFFWITHLLFFQITTWIMTTMVTSTMWTIHVMTKSKVMSQEIHVMTIADDSKWQCKNNCKISKWKSKWNNIVTRESDNMVRIKYAKWSTIAVWCMHLCCSFPNI